MCGIYGIVPTKKSTDSYNLNNLESTCIKLFQNSLSRGSEASGLAAVNEQKIHVLKIETDAKKLWSTNQYKTLKDSIAKHNLQALIGHTRMSTHGRANDNKNNQPVISKNRKIVGMHNGLVANYQAFHSGSSPLPSLDTQVLLNYLEKKIPKNPKAADLEKIFDQLEQKIEGVANLALILTDTNQLLLYSNNGSLYFLQKRGLIYFTSEAPSLKFISNEIPQQVKNKLFIFDLKNKRKPLMVQDWSNIKKIAVAHQIQSENKLSKLQQHTIDEEKIDQIKRCSKCILPATTPFITFDQDGVCNYCLEHQKITFFGKKKLENVLAKHRRRDGQADCLVAFSGGRDSSYGLHLLKKELGMNPIAFTYDWGMISDLGRRNQARLLGKLGVEQILVSADIDKKRKHIRENILAWLKKPDLGMVPLFMQGDKQCEYYADQVMRKHRIPLMIYCRGNELEKEEFKAGHCGIREADPGGVIHNLAAKNKLKLLGYYGKQYLLNPSYINSSVFDTAFGYFSTYLAKHNYLYLWHYLPWEEKKILQTLTREYGWELSPDTPTSWRIGDGTPAFYNYIYYQVQGFTENDSLRARQVREGILSRQKALELVRQENKPQYNNLKWYFDTLNLDGDGVLKKVDQMKKMYANH